jgi:hypothetical protein
MRAAPTANYSTVSAVLMYTSGNAVTSTAIALQEMNLNATEIVATYSGGGITQGQAGFFRFNASTDWLDFSAEL